MRVINLKNAVKLLVSILTALTLSGCWNFYAVRSISSLAPVEQNRPEVTKAAVYRNRIADVKRIAVLAPDGCANETSAQSKGEAGSTDSIVLKFNCGQEMALLERGLVEAGYNVISWSVVNPMPDLNNVAPLDIASKLNAQILLQVNSMERLTSHKGTISRRFFRSDSRWNVLEPVNVSEGTKTQILRHAKLREDSAHTGRSGVNLNVTATYVSNGEAIWFYDWTLFDEASLTPTETLSFSACSMKNGLCKPWSPRSERLRTKEYSSGTHEVITQSSTEDEHKARHYELLKRLISDMIKTLRDGGA